MANSENQPIGLDDEAEVEAAPLTPKDNDGVPYCRKHHCRMKYSSGGKKGSPTAYYSCPVPKCGETAQKIKTPDERVVPARPQACPRCSKGKKEVYCERDGHASAAGRVVLKCPLCGWKSAALAVPQLAAHYFARRPATPAESIGDR